MNGGRFISVDISELTNPFIVCDTPTGYQGREIEIAGDFAYIGTYYYGFRVFDIAYPLQMTPADSFSAQYGTYNVSLSENIAFVAGNGNITALDISDPYDLSELGNLSGLDGINGVEIALGSSCQMYTIGSVH